MLKKATNILIMFVLMVCFVGCGGGSASSELPTTVINQEDINTVNNLVPQREDIKLKIFEKIDGLKDLDVNNAPNRSREIGEYYFSLSKRNTEVSGENAQVTYSFVYIEGYGTSDLDKYTGNIIFFYVKEYNPIQKWEETDIQVTFGEVTSGSITGVVKNKIKDTAEVGVTVYAKAGEEHTISVITDINGQFLIPEVLENTYSVYAMKDEFEIGKKQSVVVTEENPAEGVLIELMPELDVRFASIEGYVYYNSEKTHRVEGATVWVTTEDGSASNYLTATTNSEGYYQIRFVESGTFEVHARIENNYNEGEILVVTEEQAATGNIVSVNDIILPDTAPEIIYNFPVNDSFEVTVGEEIAFIINANDAEDVILYYEWEVNGGDLKFSVDNECTWEATESGDFAVKVTIRDSMGLKSEYIWNIHSENLAGTWEVVSTTGPGITSMGGFVIHENYVYIIGGLNKSRKILDYSDTVFRTTNFIDWELVGNIGKPMVEADTISMNGNLYRLFGSNNTAWGPDYPDNTVEMSSDNGFNWNIIYSSAERKTHKWDIIYDGYIYSGGGTTYYRFSGDVNRSRDGIEWEQISTTNPIMYADPFILNGKIMIVAPTEPQISNGTIIESNDGGFTWESSKISGEFEILQNSENIHGFSFVVKNNKVYGILGCKTDEEKNYYLFSSTDGKNWVNVSDKLLNDYELILYNDNVYAVNLMAPGYGETEILKLVE